MQCEVRQTIERMAVRVKFYRSKFARSRKVVQGVWRQHHLAPPHGHRKSIVSVGRCHHLGTVLEMARSALKVGAQVKQDQTAAA